MQNLLLEMQNPIVARDLFEVLQDKSNTISNISV